MMRESVGIGELGPKWLSGIAAVIVALAGAGFFGGYATGSSKTTSSSPALPPVTVTQTIPVPTTVTVLGTAANPADHVTSSGATSPSKPTSSDVPTKGTQIGAYTINMGFPASVPLGANKPTQTDFDSRELAGDLATSYPADHLTFTLVQNNGDSMYDLPGGSTPTYAACTGMTVTSNQADSAAGTAFCISAPGRMIGVKVTSVVPRQYAVLSVTVWQNI